MMSYGSFASHRCLDQMGPMLCMSDLEHRAGRMQAEGAYKDIAPVEAAGMAALRLAFLEELGLGRRAKAVRLAAVVHRAWQVDELEGAAGSWALELVGWAEVAEIVQQPSRFPSGS